MVPECYESFYRRSLADREGFWAEQAELIDWHRRWDQVLDYSRPPFARWFAGGQTNLCHNAVDRHLDGRAEQPALTWISTETGGTASFSYRELHREVVCFAAVLRELGIGQGDRVIIYMPMIPEAAFAMLACARLGAIHSVVFGGFAGANLAKRIDDARPKLLITSDAGMRGGKVIPYKHLVDEAIRLSASPPKRVLICRRGLEPKMPIVEGRDLDYAGLRRRHLRGARRPGADRASGGTERVRRARPSARQPGPAGVRRADRAQAAGHRPRDLPPERPDARSHRRHRRRSRNPSRRRGRSPHRG